MFWLKFISWKASKLQAVVVGSDFYFFLRPKYSSNSFGHILTMIAVRVSLRQRAIKAFFDIN